MAATVTLGFISDVHLGHAAGTLSASLANLTSWLEDNFIYTECDALIVSGDLFDKGLSFTQQGMGELLRWWITFCNRARETGLVIRVLEGTELHDRKQGKVLCDAVSWMLDLDIRYIYDIEVEHHSKLGISLLYVRDNLPGTHEEITETCRSHIINSGLEQVDIAVMHNNFSYHLPPVAKVPHYNEHVFATMVRGPIVIGHNHEYSFMLNKIITPGSFDRNTHADHDEKGGVVIRYDRLSGVFNFTRLINKQARVFITLHNPNIEDIDNVINEQLQTHLRIYVTDISIKEKLFTYIKNKYNVWLTIIVNQPDKPNMYNLPLINDGNPYIFNMVKAITSYREGLVDTRAMELFDEVIGGMR